MAEKLKDLTPLRFRSAVMSACPAILEDAVTGEFVIIGTTCDPQTPELAGRVLAHEIAIRISSELVRAALKENDFCSK